MSDLISEFGNILIFILGAVVFISISLFAGYLLRPHRPNFEKLTTYESGEDAIGKAWVLFNPRFYIIALVFVLFEVEIIFLFPWATVFGQRNLNVATGGKWGWWTLWEMYVFVGVLALGLAYVWKKGYLDWEKPQGPINDLSDRIPEEMYQRFNEKYSVRKSDLS